MEDSLLLARLAAIVGPAQVLTGAGDMAPALSDWRGRYRGAARCVVRPGTAAEVAAVVRACSEAGVPIVPQGGNTGLCGGATPGASGDAVVLSLARLNRIRAVDPANNTITVEAGCTLAAVQEAAAAAGRLFPLSLASEGSCQVGGNLSTNAGGVQVLRYGNARVLTLGLEVVLPSGELWDGLRGLRKDNTGYDLKQLFIGAEGTLGIITAAVLKLFPQPRATATAWLAIATPAASLAVLARLQGAFGELLSACELVSRVALDLVIRHLPGSVAPLAIDSEWQLLVELSGGGEQQRLEEALAGCLAEAIAAGEVVDAVLAQSGDQARKLWALRENISEAQKIEGFSIKHDISLPISRIPDFIARTDAALADAFPGIRCVTFGHVGDGNLHYNQSMADPADNARLLATQVAVDRLVHDMVVDFGGSISAEHGIGQLKRDELVRYRSPVELATMRALKQALDPRGLMNPGKLL
ncbi:FAD-binding oxidoreductase [Rhodocyclus purpureus]|uniref:FAD-binding oxidoreductase n=1 Tax=Rhodocyclus purpureus TaxID=1067 RepID=UPI0019121C1D|nr:FAD-binding oxidoreductase [Rhodocyclus purpureus]MBK5915411.1 hydroxyacid dehydrogenase [Rhodocyclus purpureus]